MCKALDCNFYKQGLNKSTSVSNAQYLCIKFNMVIKAQSARVDCAFLDFKKKEVSIYET